MRVRKQVYIDQNQERELKRRAKALGVTEADILRKALDAMPQGERAVFVSAAADEALAGFLARADQVASSQCGPALPAYRRDDLYEERENRWDRRP